MSSMGGLTMEAIMQKLSDTILAIVARRPGISTVDLAFAIYGRREQPLVNGECLLLESCGKLIRSAGDAGVIKNYVFTKRPKKRTV